MNMKRFFSVLAKYKGRCWECNDDILEGDSIVYDSKEKKTYCKDCGKDLTE
jgi:hypothetical protein